MARGGLYRTDVEKARRAVLAEGKHPSIDAVRAALGNTGSRSTIHRHLKEIEADEGGASGTSVAVSDAILDLAGRLAGRLHEEADTRIAEAQARFDATLRDSAEALAVQSSQAAAFRDDLARTETCLATERTEHQQTRQLHAAARLTIAQLEERVTGLASRVTENEAHAASLEEKHRHARDALEHFRTSTKEQRDQVQRRHEHEVQTLQVELRQAGDAVREKTQDLLRLNRDNARLLEQLSQAQQATKTLEREHQQSLTELQTLRPLPAQMQALESRTAGLLAQVDRLIEEQDAAAAAELRARETLRTAELDLARTASRLEALEGIALKQTNDAGARGAITSPAVPNTDSTPAGQGALPLK